MKYLIRAIICQNRVRDSLINFVFLIGALLMAEAKSQDKYHRVIAGSEETGTDMQQWKIN